MKEEFLALATSVLRRLENILSETELKEDYVYKKIPQLVNEVTTWNFSSPKTDIGLAAIKLEDMGIYKEKKIVDDLVHLSELYRLMQKPAARK